jgi:hypothetical protein
MRRYIYCASNESIPDILCISYATTYFNIKDNSPPCSLKRTLDMLNEKHFEFCHLHGRASPNDKYRQLPTPYCFEFIKKWDYGNKPYTQIIYELKLKLNIVDKCRLVRFGPNFYRNSIEEVKVLFDIFKGDYVDYITEDALIKKEFEDKIINNHFKTLEDILEKLNLKD